MPIRFTFRKAILFISTSCMLTASLVGCGPGGATTTCSSDISPVFTHNIIDPERFSQALVPWRADSGEIKGHGNIRVTGPGNTAAIYAPTDLTLIAGNAGTDGGLVTGVNAPASYLLMLQVSCEVTIRLDHVHKPVAKIASVLKIDGGYTEISPGVTFAAGELIGYAEDFSDKVPAQLSNFDFGVQNTGITPAIFANQSRYANAFMPAKLNADCPYSYFTPDLRAGFLAMLSDDGGNSIADATACTGRVTHDVAGTISGAWFPASDTGASYGPDHLSIALESPALLKISGLVDWNLDGSKVTNPTTVTGDACYSNNGQYLFLHLTSASTLTAVVGADACPGTFAGAVGMTTVLSR